MSNTPFTFYFLHPFNDFFNAKCDVVVGPKGCSLFDESNINFYRSIVPENLTLAADSELIEQVIINLLLNAQFAVKNSQNPEISISSYTDNRGKIIIRVEDNGPGISKE